MIDIQLNHRSFSARKIQSWSMLCGCVVCVLWVNLWWPQTLQAALVNPQDEQSSDDLQEFALTRIGEYGESVDWNGVYLLAFSPDAKLLAARNSKQHVCVYEIATGEKKYEIDGHDDRVLAIAFSPDSKLLATAGRGNEETIKLWNAETGEQVGKFDGGALQLNFAQQGNLLLALGENQISEINFEQISQDVKTKWNERRYNSLAMTPNAEKVCRFFETSRATSYQELTIDNLLNGKKTVVSGLAARPTSASFSHDGQHLVVLYRRDSKVCLWNLNHPNQKRVLTGHDETVQAAAFSSDDRILATVGWDHKVVLWDVITGRQLADFSGHSENVCAVAFSDDSKKLATGASGGTDCSIIVWDAFKAAFPEHTEQPVVMDQQTLDKNWNNLASDDPTIALRSVSLLSRESDLAIDFFNQFVTRKTNIASAANIKQLIQQLGAPVYEERIDAFNKLQSLRSVSENMLREALNDKSLSSEIRLAVGELLQQTHKQPEIAKDEYRQLLRLVHILEMNGSDQARAILELLQRGHQHIEIVQAATGALTRMQ